MLILGCRIVGCKEQVANTGEDVAIAPVNAHTSTHTGNTDCNQDSSVNKIVELANLKITQGLSLNSWNPVQVLWRLHQTGADLSEAKLMHYCSEEQ